MFNMMMVCVGGDLFPSLILLDKKLVIHVVDKFSGLRGKLFVCYMCVSFVYGHYVSWILNGTVVSSAF